MNEDHPPDRDGLVGRAIEHLKEAEHDIERARESERRAEHELELAREDERRAEREIEEAARELERAASQPPAETEIIVNARPRIVPGDRVGFAEIVQLAFPGSAPNQNSVYAMTYRHAASAPHAGELGVGGMVHVKQGTVFNVTKTVRS